MNRHAAVDVALGALASGGTVARHEAAEVRAYIDALEDELIALRDVRASAAHDAKVLADRIAELLADVARLTAERDEARAKLDDANRGLKEAARAIEILRLKPLVMR